MQIKMKSMAFTQQGMFDKGQVLTDKQYSKAFLLHLVNDANAADMFEYETKIEQPVETKVEQPIKQKKKKKVKRKRT
jgi:hypothetical protein